MNFDSLLLAAVADELMEAVVPGKVERVTQPDPHTIVLGIYKAGQKHSVLISCEPASARIHLTSQPRKSPSEAPAFCMLLRKYLEGARLEEVTHPFGLGERVLRLRFVGHDQSRYDLFAEVMGKNSNLILVNDFRTVLGALKRVTVQMSPSRQVRAGLPYAAPPKQKAARRDPYSPGASHDLSTGDLASPDEAEAWLLATFSAVSPRMAREAVALVAGPGFTPEALWYALNELLNCARLAQWAPILILNADGQPEGAYPLPLTTVAAERQMRIKSISAALDRTYANLSRQSAFAGEKAALISALGRARKAREREQIDINDGLSNALRAEEYKEAAQLLQASGSVLSEARDEVELPDYFSDKPGAVRVVALDPKLTLQENAERYFNKYRKARDSQAILEARKEMVEAALAALMLAQSDALAAESPNQLAEARERAEGRFSAPQEHRKGARKEEESPYAGYRIRTYRSTDGWEILVGENSASNDFLTTKVASPADIWLHARAIPSAHAVIRTQNRPVSVSPAALRLAAEQVARRSQAKHARVVPVDYTLKKYVRKPRRAAPGEVTYSHEKTLDIAPADADDK